MYQQSHVVRMTTAMEDVMGTLGYTVVLLVKRQPPGDLLGHPPPRAPDDPPLISDI